LDGVIHTDLVELDGVVLGAQFAQSLLGGIAVWTVGLAEDGYMHMLAHPLPREGRYDLPTALSSMMPWALVLAADMIAGLIAVEKKRRRNEMLGNLRLERRCFMEGKRRG
jgi:hypothetical protein